MCLKMWFALPVRVKDNVIIHLPPATMVTTITTVACEKKEHGHALWFKRMDLLWLVM